MLSQLKKILDKDIHLKELITGSTVTFVLKMLGMLFGYILIYIISNRNGAEGVGNYNIFVKTITVLGAFTSLGINVAVLRYVGQFNNVTNQGKITSLYNQGFKTVFSLSVLIGFLIYFNAEFIIQIIGKSKEQIINVKLLSIALPFFALNQVNVEFIRGLKKLQLSELIRSVIRPFLIVLLLIFWKKNDFNKIDVLYFFVFGICVNWVISSLIIRKKVRSIKREVKSLFSHKELIITAFPMMITSISSILLISLPIFFLDYFFSQTEVGIFSVVFQIAMLISIVMIIINTIVAPKFSELFWANKKTELQKFISQSVNIMFSIALIVSIVVTVFSEFILNIFGNEFKDGQYILVILVIGQLISVSIGSVGILMNMVGKQKALRNINLIALIICLILYILVVPNYGLIGCSVVFVFGLSFTKIVAAIYMRKKMGLTTFLNPFFKI